MRKGSLAFAALLLFGAGAAAGEELEPAPPGADARSIAEKVEDVFRGRNSYLKATMTVVSPRLPTPRRVEFRAWDDRPEKRSFIRILAPPKDAGMAFLKLGSNLWNFIPRVERTIRIPPSMMLQSWMGSDFTNDDLVRESSQLDDYDHQLLGIDPEPDGVESERAYVIEYRPHEDAPVVWGKIVTWVDVARYAPLRQDFYDEDGEKLRVIRFSEIHEVQGRPYPHRWSLVPIDKEGHETLIEIEEIRFDEDFDERIFTKRHLTSAD
jgi:outer membrane lipoprotein-sorting protein